MNISTGLRVALAASLLSGCFPKPSETYACATTSQCDDDRQCVNGYCVVPGGGGADGGSDSGGGGDAAELCLTFETRHFTDVCANITKPTGTLELTEPGTYTYDSNSGMLLSPNLATSMPLSEIRNGMRVISVQTFLVAATSTLRINGPHPVLIASWGTASVLGTIDVSSVGLAVGTGSNPAACTTAAAVTQPKTGETSSGGGGGGGGGNASAGGTGGGGNDGNSNGGAGGGSLGTATLHGGCTGARGGNGPNPAGVGGVGGGAVEILAYTSISIANTARINAGGGGGKQATGGNGGGGGGGAGGMIGLEAPSITLTGGAVLAANGGGGGQGGGNEFGTAGPGQDAMMSTQAAPGGTGGSGGPGGAGSISSTMAASLGAEDGAGGGGGGGGGGYVTVRGMLMNSGATISPAPTILP